jgi:hypothetical protein
MTQIHIYFLGQNEIGVLKKDPTGQYIKKVDSFNKIKGMLNDDLQNISILQNNKVLYGAKEGFIICDPVKDLSIRHQFDVLIRRVTLTGNPDSIIYYGNTVREPEQKNSMNSSNIYVLPYEHNSMRFEYSSTYLDGLDMTSYQYKLEGFDQDWSPWENNNQKEYTNLNEGKYAFQIRAKNINGHISPDTTFQVRINPPLQDNSCVCNIYLTFCHHLYIVNRSDHQQT